MAKIIYGDDLMFNLMDQSQVNPAFDQYVNAQMAQLAAMPGIVGSSIMAGTQALIEKVKTSDVYRRAEAALHYGMSLWGQNQIQQLEHLWQIQNAPNVMVPYLMANPTIRQLWIKDACEGYGERYFDDSPGAIGEDHEDYCRVMNGAVSFTDTGWEATTYVRFDERYDNVPTLSVLQAMKIRDAWQMMDDAIAAGRDPTSRWDADL